jgi:undecaprenyl-phosphate 4-deoxy-4-formamido-L-arabinose transferase
LNTRTEATVSVVIPCYNEEKGLASLFARLYPALDALGRVYEVVFVDDGSSDRTVAGLREQFSKRPDVTRVVVLTRNVGQHMAIMAGFAQTRGDYIITLDADLQNPPEEITNIIAAMEAGADYVGTVRKNRHDVYWRKAASRLMNRFRERTTHIRITDQGCMLRGYDREIVDAINSCVEVSTFVPALGYTFARNPVEIEVSHAERAVGQSKYSLYSLIRLNFDRVPAGIHRTGDSPPGARAGSRRPVYAVCDRVLPHRCAPHGRRRGGRIRGPYLRAGTSETPLYGCSIAGTECH